MNHFSIAIDQYTDHGRKDVNQDFHGARIPTGPLRHDKGAVIALADGISTSAVSQVASEMAVTSFLNEYFLTPSTQSIEACARQVLTTINQWLYTQSQKGESRYNKNLGHVCTFSGLIIQSNTAHIFHIGDARVYLLRDQKLAQLTTDHKGLGEKTVGKLSQNRVVEAAYLTRALGVSEHCHLDYASISLAVGDVLLLATDGVYDFLSEKEITAQLNKVKLGELEQASMSLAKQAYQNGSKDNLTAQIVKIMATV